MRSLESHLLSGLLVYAAISISAIFCLTLQSGKVEQITEALELGEGPHWSTQHQALYFVDIVNETIHKYEPATRLHTRTKVDGQPGFIVNVEGTTDQFIVGLERQFAIVQWDGKDGSKAEVVRVVAETDEDVPFPTRINDGKADPRGRIFAGTMGREVTDGTVLPNLGSLYRLDGNTITKVETNITVANGLSWDLKEKAFYYIDSLEYNIRRYDYDVETGNISNKTYIFDLKANGVDGVPDGHTIDTDGNLWVALVGPGVVAQIDPRTSRLLRKVFLPVADVTSATFGGPNYDILFVTSANFEGNQPIGGYTYQVTGLGVKGHPNINYIPHTVEQITEALQLGEGPHWSTQHQALYFVDITDESIHKYDPATKLHTRTKVDGKPGFIVNVEGTTDQFIVGLERQFAIVQWDGKDGSKAEVVRVVAETDEDVPFPTRINDGKADPRGRIFAGTMGREIIDGAPLPNLGSLYRLDGNTITKVETDITVANGLSWDLKEKAFYYIDTLEYNIRRYDYDVETGNISNKTYIFDLKANGVEGAPDGHTIDTDGNLWVALVGPGCVAQIDPRTSRLLRKVFLPVADVTSATFGGPNYDILFVTSANFEGNQPIGGYTYQVTGLGVKGHPNINYIPHTVEQITEALQLGEGPHWSTQHQALYFVDITDESIHKYDPATKLHTRTKVDGKPGFIVNVEGTTDQFIVGLERQFAIVQWDGKDGSKAEVVRVVAETDEDVPFPTRINDGKADPRGRIFAGTMGREIIDGAPLPNLGSLYRLDGNTITKVETDITVANGLSWDLKEKAFYYIDTLEYNIRRYDYDVETGNISNKTYIFDLKANGVEGAPDGHTIDTDGNLWVALVGPGCVAQIDPRTSRLLRKVFLPVADVTSATFGGPNYDILFVTSANFEGNQPIGGYTYQVTGLGVKGHPNINYIPHTVEQITEALQLGEGPHWSTQHQALYFVDITDESIHKYDPATKLHTRTKVDGKPGFIVNVEGTTDQFIVGLERQFAIVQWDGKDGSKAEVVRVVAETDEDVPFPTRINDGKADPRGRIFAGTMGREIIDGAPLPNLGSLYRLDGNTITKVETDITVANGLSWDLKEKAFYYIDTLEYNIRRYDYDVETGNISNKTYIFDLKANGVEGAPDGHTIDTDGNLWVALVGPGCVAQIDPRTSRLLRKVFLPVADVTSATFGGPNYDILFVTSANFEGNQPIGGYTYQVTGLGVKGHPNINYIPHTVEQITEALQLGEGPHWSTQHQALYFVDIADQSIHKYELATRLHTKTKVDGMPGFIVNVEGTTDQFIVGLERQFAIVQWDGKDGSKAEVVRVVAETDEDVPIPTRINDGKADPRGRIFAGTMGREIIDGTILPDLGSLYRLDGNTITKVETNITVANGLSWDLKEKAFYYTDSFEYNIRRYDYDVETGNISNKTYIFDLKANGVEGSPDGHTIDTDGNLWVALVGPGVVAQIDPRTSRLLRKVYLPVGDVTSATFGGPNYDILFVTSANFAGNEPIGGYTYKVTGLGVKGHPNIYYRPHTVEQITEALQLGEGPHWSTQHQALYFVDITDESIHKYELATRLHTRTKVDGQPGFIVNVEGTTDQFIVGLERQFAIVQWDGKDGSKAEVVRVVAETDEDVPIPTRINDGKADPRGRIFAGTMGREIMEGPTVLPDLGSLYRLDGNTITKVETNISVANGLSWDLKEKAFYYTDSFEYNIRRYDYDVETGNISNKTYIFDFKANGVEGSPDGHTIDTDGNLWVALVGPGVVAQIDPRTSRLLRKVYLPVGDVTSATFGGPNYDILFVTSANFAGNEPIGGYTYKVTGLGVKGLPNIYYRPYTSGGMRLHASGLLLSIVLCYIACKLFR